MDHPFIPKLWATRKIGYLLDQIRLHGEDTELREAVVQLSTDFGIVTPYTSFLITDETKPQHTQVWRSRELRSLGYAGEGGRAGADVYFEMNGAAAPQAELEPTRLNGLHYGASGSYMHATRVTGTVADGAFRYKRGAEDQDVAWQQLSADLRNEKSGDRAIAF
ncbi:MAG: hypothetical protein JRE16_02145, partial [Deltaproteobacteria bacterium]|nr:hypothetical protein [Deltaproteobacteria bacterium]